MRYHKIKQYFDFRNVKKNNNNKMHNTLSHLLTLQRL